MVTGAPCAAARGQRADDACLDGGVWRRFQARLCLRSTSIGVRAIDLDALTQSLKLLTDPTRLRLLRLLEGEELSVAELAAALNLAQPRVSTHLARLKEAGWVVDRRAGVSAFYRRAESGDIDNLLTHLGATLDDAQLQADASRRAAVLAARERPAPWADQVAGDMEKHYSPGRTWEALTHALLPLLALGEVLDMASGDGAVAELLAPHVRSLTCVDVSERVVAAARQRLAGHPHVRCVQADMHALPFSTACFDLVLLLQALPYADPVSAVLGEAGRVLKPGGMAIGTWLLPHEHAAVTEPYGHRNLGTAIGAIESLARAHGLEPLSVRLACVEHRPPHFRIGGFSLRKRG